MPKGGASQEKGNSRGSEAPESETDRGKDRDADAEAQRRNKGFEARKPYTCFNCGEVGNFAASCTKTKLVFYAVESTDDNIQLLESYMRYLFVNDKACRVLRDSAATVDVVRPIYVQPHQMTGEFV